MRANRLCRLSIPVISRSAGCFVRSDVAQDARHNSLFLKGFRNSCKLISLLAISAQGPSLRKPKLFSFAEAATSFARLSLGTSIKYTCEIITSLYVRAQSLRG